MARIKRSDAIYLEIESFADYELTQCITYEMAVRDKKNLKAIEEAIEFYKTHDILEESIYDYELLEKPISNRDALTEIINKLVLIPYILPECDVLGNIICEDIIDKKDFLHNFFENFDTYIDSRINKKIYEIINEDYLNLYYCELRGIKSEDARVVWFDEGEKVSLEKRSFRDGYTIFTSISTLGGYAYIPLNPEDENSETVPINSVEDFQLLIDMNLFDSLSHESTITTNFKRPKIKLPHSYNTMPTKLDIDLNKPLNEIISLIEHIKKDFDSNKHIFKTPIELLGEKINRADSLICDKAGKCFDSRQILSKQQRLSDMFFIYDALKEGMTQRQIQNEIFNYYADKGIETKTMDAKTLKKYKEIAIDYIDNERYKELITGVKTGI